MLEQLREHNTVFVLLSVGAAIFLGILTPELFAPIQFLGELFINVLKVFALPLICSALICALAETSSNLGNLRNIARNAIGYVLFSEIAAVTIALVLFNVFQPGVGLSSDLILHGKEYVAAGSSNLSFQTFILSVFPSNIFESLGKFDLLPVVIFSVLFGLGAGSLGESSANLIALARSVRDTCTACLNGAMVIAPLGIFSLVGSGVAQSYASGNAMGNLTALLSYVVVLLIGLFIHGLWQLLLASFLTKQSPLFILKKSISVFSTAFATSSSVSTLPLAMETADELKSHPQVTRFMLPAAAAINIGGMMMYEVTAALFFTQVLGIQLDLFQQIGLGLVCILGGMAAGGIPETSMVSLVIVFNTVNIPLSAISVLLPLDRIIDRFRTMVNIFGNMCGVISVSRFVR